jgi:hypothetical protein
VWFALTATAFFNVSAASLERTCCVTKPIDLPTTTKLLTVSLLKPERSTNHQSTNDGKHGVWAYRTLSTAAAATARAVSAHRLTNDGVRRVDGIGCC